MLALKLGDLRFSRACGGFTDFGVTATLKSYQEEGASCLIQNFGVYFFFLGFILQGTVESLTDGTREAVKKVILRTLNSSFGVSCYKVDIWDLKYMFLLLEWIGMNAMLVYFMAVEGIFAGFINGCIMLKLEAIDLLMKVLVEDLDLLVAHVDSTNFRSTCLNLTSAARIKYTRYKVLWLVYVTCFSAFLSLPILPFPSLPLPSAGISLCNIPNT
ncbi:hypothetical protein Ddye_009014 [Dipteronia dyeriana]|uniref:Uncharacterized protein n=1 Tax=Dipteronia dyeriana TaxID=168575 RepID=A0AAE0CLV4_9ROSI|nr:hypothetical protein Ddye_009014 [Dipteronia dyeriana]